MDDLTPTRRAGTIVAPALLLALGVITWQHLLHVKFVLRTNDGLLELLPHIGRDAVLAVPFAFIAVGAGRLFAQAITIRQHSPGLLVRAAVITEVFFVLVLSGVPAHGWIDGRLGGAHVDEGAMLSHALRDALIGQAVALPIVLFGLWLVGPGRRLDLRGRCVAVSVVVVFPALLLAGAPTVLVAAALGLLALPRVDVRVRRVGFASMTLIASAVIVSPSLQTASPVSAAHGECSVVSPVRQYDVVAIDVDIVFNAFGDHDPEGKMFVLRNRISDVRNAEASGQVTPGLRDDAIQPLVIRANLGDCLEIVFDNELAGRDASFHVTGLPFTAANAGGNVGFNPSSLAAPGATITYRFQVPSDPNAEGSYVFNSMSDTRYTMSHGLFGTLVLEPAGSQYLDPADPTKELESGWEAIIADPNGTDFREFNIVFHEVGNEDFLVLRADGTPVPLIDPTTGVYRPVTRALNFRSEAFLNRLELVEDKSLGYSSYAFGDPATPMPFSYLGEPTKTRISHPGSEMFHVYHLHGGGNRWRRNPKAETGEWVGGLKKVPTQDAQTSRVDSQSVGPGEAFTLEHECGAGGCQQAAGDFLFHCHIGDHYLAGMWAFWRVFDTVQAELPMMPPDVNYTAPPVAQHGTSLDLLGTQVDGKTLVPAANLVDSLTELALEDHVAGLLPPAGVRLDSQDATVWDWQIDYVNGDPTQPLVLGEPDDTAVWANYASETPGQRPQMKFNLDNARLAWPQFSPHLGTRPPFSPNGHSGAPWLGENGDPGRPDAVCPSTDVVPGRQILNYPITAIDTPIEVADGVFKPDGKIYTLNEDLDDVRSGAKPAEPLVLRSNVGDCSRIILTSEQEDENHGGHAKVNMHTHFVQFDPQASDGVVTGFAYEQGVRPIDSENRTLTAPATPGATTVVVTNVDRLRVGISIGVGLGEGMCDPSTGAPVTGPDNGDRPCTEVRDIVGIAGNVITLDQPLENVHAVGEAAGVEFAQHLWYSDVDSGTVFWHDHVNFSNWKDGLFGAMVVEPAGSTWHDPVTGAEIRSGSMADIHAPLDSSQGVGQQGSFREVLAMMSDDSFVTGPGVPANTVTSPINMRAAPLILRDPTFPFSSVTNGDPDTPILRAYVGDPVVIRGLGVMEREGTIRVSGHRFREERYLADSTLVDTIQLGISEREDLVLEGGAGGTAGLPGDFLFYNAVNLDLNAGSWGLLRVHDTEQSDLQPLPDYGAPAAGAGFPSLTETGGAPPAATSATLCPPGAPERNYDVTAIQNPDSLVDFGGMMYALSSQEPALLAGAIQPEPLVMRVQEGDCLRISLTNHFLTARASIDLARLASAFPGSAVGWNGDASVPPGGTIDYEFYADAELGTSLFFNLAAPATIPLGAFGAVIVEPAGSTWRNPVNGGDASTGVRADILHPDGNFREHVLLMQESDERIGQNIMPYTIEVRNFSGINYGTDPFFDTSDVTGRLVANADPSLVFDSAVHGDPMNLVRAYPGDPVTLRVGMPTAEQSNTFAIDGHRFPWEPDLAGSTQLATLGMFAGESHAVELIGGAGGGVHGATDYLFGNGRVPHVEAGMWGILRTYGSPQLDLLPIVSPTPPPGMLRVTTDPAVPTQISVDGTPMDSWALTWLKIQPGQHEVCFSDVAGFDTPGCQTISVSSNQTTQVVGAFTARGFLQVTTSPPVPSTISVDGEPRNDWGMWTDLAVGQHQVCFGAVDGFTPPACETVTVVAGANTAIVGDFTASSDSGPPGLGRLRVVSSPPVPSQIVVDGIERDTWSLTWMKIDPGVHEICFSDVDGFATPPCQTVQVDADASTVVQGDFAAQGFLRVLTDPPVPGTIIVDGEPRNDWGMWTSLPTGLHEVCFGDVVGRTTPTCQAVTITSGTTSTVTGLYG